MENEQKFISTKGLKGYIIFLALVYFGYLYLQLNGILIYNSTKAEHEGNSHIYGQHHK